MADEIREKTRYEKLNDILYKYQWGPANYRLEDAFVDLMQLLVDEELNKPDGCSVCGDQTCGCHKTVGG